MIQYRIQKGDCDYVSIEYRSILRHSWKEHTACGVGEEGERFANQIMKLISRHRIQDDVKFFKYERIVLYLPKR